MRVRRTFGTCIHTTCFFRSSPSLLSYYLTPDDEKTPVEAQTTWLIAILDVVVVLVSSHTPTSLSFRIQTSSFFLCPAMTAAALSICSRCTFISLLPSPTPSLALAPSRYLSLSLSLRYVSHTRVRRIRLRPSEQHATNSHMRAHAHGCSFPTAFLLSPSLGLPAARPPFSSLALPLSLAPAVSLPVILPSMRLECGLSQNSRVRTRSRKIFSSLSLSPSVYYCCRSLLIRDFFCGLLASYMERSNTRTCV
jgi:hypothetical protein